MPDVPRTPAAIATDPTDGTVCIWFDARQPGSMGLDPGLAGANTPPDVPHRRGPPPRGPNERAPARVFCPANPLKPGLSALAPAAPPLDRRRGPLLPPPADPGYDEARTIWTAMTRRRPAVIARVSGSADVIACVNFARENGLPLSVRGGGHNVAGTALCDGGLMIDMSLRRGVRVDPTRRIVRA